MRLIPTRHRALPLACVLSLALTAAIGPTAKAAPSTPAAAMTSIKATACKETDRLNDRREITCEIPAGAPARRFSFKAMFSGGHDDTAASLEPTLGDQPFKCDDGSKLSLFGEDGNVSLHCHFSAASAGSAGSAASTKATKAIKVLIKWSHAEYEDYDFVAE